MNRASIESAIRANRRSILAMATSAQLATIDGASLERAKSELGIVHWSCESRCGVWISTLVSECGVERMIAIGEGHDPLAAERDAFWFLARAYARRVEACREEVAA